MDSGDTFKHLYLFVKYGGAPFIKDLAVVKEGNDLPAGFVQLNMIQICQ